MYIFSKLTLYITNVHKSLRDQVYIELELYDIAIKNRFLVILIEQIK